MADRAMQERYGRVFWITGLSGSGKSTLGGQLMQWLRARGKTVVLLDGDAIRDMLLEPMGHDRESRLRIARFNGRLCRLLASQGLDVVCPTISLFHECQAWNRVHIPGYVEIFLDAPLELLITRDHKGIYQRSQCGALPDVVGMDIPAETPLRPDVTIRCSQQLTPEQMLHAVVAHIEEQDHGEYQGNQA